jgi:hypothetical protein
MTTTKTIIRGGGNLLPFLNSTESTEPENPTFLSLTPQLAQPSCSKEQAATHKKS